MRLRTIEGNGHDVQQDRDGVALVRFIMMCRLATAHAREVLDEHVFVRGIWVELEYLHPQRLLHRLVDFRRDRPGSPVVAGEGFTFRLAIHHLHALGLVKARTGTAFLLRIFLFQIEVQGTAVRVAVVAQGSYITRVVAIQQGEHGLLAIVAVEEGDPLGDAFKPLTRQRVGCRDQGVQLPACRRGQNAFGSVHFFGEVIQHNDALDFQKPLEQRHVPDLAHQSDEVLHTRQELRAMIRSLLCDAGIRC